MTELTEKRNDEIDLIELIEVLWKKKIWILISAFIFTAIAGVYAFTAKEQWTSTAEVISPTAVEMGRYANAKLRFAQIANQQDVTLDSIAKSLYSQFDRLAFSQNERRDFFMQSDEYKRLITGLDENAQRKVLSNLSIEYTAIVRPDPKKNQDMFGNRISFSSETPLSAQQTLSEFIAFVNKKAFNLDKSSFQFQIAQKIESLATEKEEIETTLAAKKDLNISSINNIQPQLTQGNSSTTGQSQPTQPLDTTTSMLAYGDEYARLQLSLLDSRLKQLTALQDEVKGLEGQAFSYQASPDYPVKRDWPKRIILLLVGAILGSVLGSLWILGKQIFGNK